MLKVCYGEGDLELYEGHIDLTVDKWKSAPLISLREAASRSNPKNEFVASRCGCKTKCATASCSCKSRGVSCNSKCHKGLACSNQPETEEVDTPNNAPPAKKRRVNAQSKKVRLLHCTDISVIHNLS